MHSVEVKDINELLVAGCELVKKHGMEIKTRGTVSKEVRPCLFKVEYPTRRTLVFPGRGNNPFQTIFECLWVLSAKDNNISDLRRFLPRADLYSDNPDTPYSRWRAGYPERIRNASCMHSTKLICTSGEIEYVLGKAMLTGIDQLKYVYESLLNDDGSRQAVMGLWNPIEDTYEHGVLLKTKDKPCTQSVMFTIRNYMLDCVVTMRSNDVIYGLSSINMYEFTVMQEILAKMLGVAVGKYYHFTNSLHVYDNMYDKMNKIVETYHHSTEYVQMKNLLNRLPNFQWTGMVVAGDYTKTMQNIEAEYKLILEMSKNVEETYKGVVCDDEFRLNQLSELSNYCLIYLLVSELKISNTTAYHLFKSLRDTDLKLGCLYWVCKQYPETKNISVTHLEVLFNSLTYMG
jgi:thymidylate synthase